MEIEIDVINKDTAILRLFGEEIKLTSGDVQSLILLLRQAENEMTKLALAGYSYQL